MKIYIASKFGNRKYVKKVYEQLKRVGHEITYDWTSHEKPSDVSPHEFRPTLKNWAVEDYSGVSRADVLIFLPPGGRGAHVEIGIALGKTIPVIIIGDIQGSVFYDHPLVHRYNNIEEFVQCCEGIL